VEGGERRGPPLVPRFGKLPGEMLIARTRDLREQGLPVAEMTIGRGGADAGEPCGLGQGEPFRAALGDELARRFHQDFLQVAMVIAAPATPVLAVRPVHVKSVYLKARRAASSGSGAIPSCRARSSRRSGNPPFRGPAA